MDSRYNYNPICNYKIIRTGITFNWSKFSESSRIFTDYFGNPDLQQVDIQEILRRRVREKGSANRVG